MYGQRSCRIAPGKMSASCSVARVLESGQILQLRGTRMLTLYNLPGTRSVALFHSSWYFGDDSLPAPLEFRIGIMIKDEHLRDYI